MAKRDITLAFSYSQMVIIIQLVAKIHWKISFKVSSEQTCSGVKHNNIVFEAIHPATIVRSKR